MPYDKIVFDQWRKEGVLTSLHFCGNSTPVWNDIVEAGIHNIEVDQTVDLAEAKGKVIHRACLTGNIGPSAIIRYGTTEDVEKKTRVHTGSRFRRRLCSESRLRCNAGLPAI